MKKLRVPKDQAKAGTLSVPHESSEWGKTRKNAAVILGFQTEAGLPLKSDLLYECLLTGTPALLSPQGEGKPKQVSFSTPGRM